jgi:hypothetical protein
MKTLLFIFLITCYASSKAQITKETDLSYTDNYFTQDRYKALKEKPDDIKYETQGASLLLTHQSKGLDAYASSDLFPRSDFHEYIRDFSLSFNFSFTASSGNDNFFGVSFLISPHEDIDWKDSAAFVYYFVTPEGKLYSMVKNIPYDGRICYTCPPLLKDKNVKKIFDTEYANTEQIQGFNVSGVNTFSLKRTDDKLELFINNKKIKENNKMAKGYFSSRMAPIVVMKGKATIKLENLKEDYGHQNSALLKYMKDFSGSGTATVSGRCISGSPKVAYELTTLYGIPSIKLTWKPSPDYNMLQTVYFDFKEGDDYGVYKHRGLSSKQLIMFGEGGDAREIKINPKKGELSFDFYFQGGVSSRKSGIYTYTTQQYCSITISSDQ